MTTMIHNTRPAMSVESIDAEHTGRINTILANTADGQQQTIGILLTGPDSDHDCNGFVLDTLADAFGLPRGHWHRPDVMTAPVFHAGGSADDTWTAFAHAHGVPIDVAPLILSPDYQNGTVAE